LLKYQNKPLTTLAATQIGYAATSAIAIATAWIFLICIHGFTVCPQPETVAEG
jgi:hypothetical protein